MFWLSDIFFFKLGWAGGTFIFHSFQKLRQAADIIFFFDVNTHVRRRDIYTHNFQEKVSACTGIKVCFL